MTSEQPRARSWATPDRQELSSALRAHVHESNPQPAGALRGALRDGRSGSQPVFGREPELELLDGLLVRGRTGGESLVIRGEPGVGKTFLLEAAWSRAEALGTQVIGVSGIECETRLAFAGLHQLLRPLIDGVRELPSPQRGALEVAFGFSAGQPPELFLLGLATLTLLSESAGRRPLLLIADDAQWLDQPTLEVLAFVARRVSLDAIVLLAAVRGGTPTPLDAAQLPQLPLCELDPASARELVEATAPDVAPSVVERIVSLAEGNPLALVELPPSLRSDPLGAQFTLSEPIALAERLKQTFASRLRDIPSETTLLLLIAALNDSDVISETVAAATIILGAPPPSDALAPAEAANLIEPSAGGLRFRHPLVRAAIRQMIDPAQRRLVHASLADVLTAQPDRRIWHLAAATVDADETVAEMLEQVASRAGRQGGLAVAAAALERAADLSASSARRGSRLVRAAEIALDVAPPEKVAHLIAEAESLDLDVLDRGRLTLIRELVTPMAVGDPASMLPLIDAAERLRGVGHDELAVKILWAAAASAFHVDGDASARAKLVVACERLRVQADDPYLLSALAMAAPTVTAGTVIERCRSRASDLGGNPDEIGLVGAALSAVGAAVLSHGFLTAAATRMRKDGRVRPLARALALRAMASFLLGNWPSAEVDAAEATEFANETGQPVFAAAALSAHALIAGARGETQAESLAGQAERLALPARARAALAMVQMARGLIALSAGRHDAAYHELRRVFDTGDLAHHSAKCGRSIGLLAEAAIHSGHEEEARTLLRDASRRAERSASPWQALAVRHAEALLAESDKAETLFEASLAEDLTLWPFERARLQLAYGAWLRRQRRAADSRAPLRAARDTFDALGAVPWSGRAGQELRASGERILHRGPEARDELSPQEFQIATMAAAGLSNREIGEKLYLSHRTVGSHLYRIFPKLGITSRGELPRALAGSGAWRAVEDGDADQAESGRTSVRWLPS